MAFHSDKCNVLSITRNKTPVKCPYTLHGHQLEHADKAKYLGVTMQSDLKWDNHINSIRERPFILKGGLWFFSKKIF